MDIAMSLRNILLLRHGEAEHISPVGDDHGRRLTPRGRRQIATVCHHLDKLNYRASIVYCSDSRRTVETLENLASRFFHGVSPKYESPLYNASEETVCNYLFQTAETAPSILIVGHNPALSDLASYLLQEEIYHGTGDAILLEAELDSWLEGGKPGRWKLIQHIQPGKMV
jgi:phosphohistidine phosphatase